MRKTSSFLLSLLLLFSSFSSFAAAEPIASPTQFERDASLFFSIIGFGMGRGIRGDFGLVSGLFTYGELATLTGAIVTSRMGSEHEGAKNGFIITFAALRVWELLDGLYYISHLPPPPPDDDGSIVYLDATGSLVAGYRLSF